MWLFYWPYIVSSGCIYLFDHIITTFYVLLKFVCVAHFVSCLNSLSLSHMSYQWWLLIFFFCCYFLKEIVWSDFHKDKNKKFLKSSQNTFKQSDPCEARVRVFVLRCSASVTVASHSWMLYLMQDFTCVYISFTSVHSLKKDKMTKKY